MAPGAGDISSCHFGHSVLWITIETGEPSVVPVADAAEELDVVALEAHAGTAAEPEAAAGELVADLLDGDGQARGQTLDHHREGGAVGLTGGQVTQHADDLGRLGPGTGTFQDTGALSDASLAHRRSRRRDGSAAVVPVDDRAADEDRGDRAGGEERAERDCLALARGRLVAMRTRPITAP